MLLLSGQKETVARLVDRNKSVSVEDPRGTRELEELTKETKLIIEGQSTKSEDRERTCAKCDSSLE